MNSDFFFHPSPSSAVAKCNLGTLSKDDTAVVVFTGALMKGY